jgi:hypothetical protein
LRGLEQFPGDRLRPGTEKHGPRGAVPVSKPITIKKKFVSELSVVAGGALGFTLMAAYAIQ